MKKKQEILITGAGSFGKTLAHKFLNSENTKQETSSDPVGDTRELGTGCDSEASGTMESKELDAAPLRHKIEDEKICGCFKMIQMEAKYYFKFDKCHRCGKNLPENL